jgi:hypothetical protein
MAWIVPRKSTRMHPHLRRGRNWSALSSLQVTQLRRATMQDISNLQKLRWQILASRPLRTPYRLSTPYPSRSSHRNHNSQITFSTLHKTGLRMTVGAPNPSEPSSTDRAVEDVVAGPAVAEGEAERACQRNSNMLSEPQNGKEKTGRVSRIPRPAPMATTTTSPPAPDAEA